MSVFNIIKKILSSLSSKRSSEKFPDDLKELRSQYEANLLELKEKLAAVQGQNEDLQKSLVSKEEEIKVLNSHIDKLKQELNKQADMLNNETSENNELRDRYLNLQNENELLIGRSSSVVSKLICFCQLLKTIDFSSVDECIAAIKDEIEKSSSDLGFDIMDTYDGEFDSKLHCVVATKETDNSLLDNHIADVVRPGIWFDGKCLIPQDVIIYKVSK